MCEKSDVFVSAQSDGAVETVITIGNGWVKLAQTPEGARWFAQELFAAADRVEGRKAMEKLKVCGE